MLLTLALLLSPLQDSTLTVTFLDVGQGDAVLILSPAGRYALVDAGPATAGVADRLGRMGIASLELAVVSHPHADHLGGMADVLRRLTVRHYLDNGDPYTTQAYRRTMQALERSGALYLDPTAGDGQRTLTLDGVNLTVLPPARDGRRPNDRSVGLHLTFGAFRLLLTGDAETRALARFQSLVAAGGPVHVLKAAHHGARNGVTPGFLNTVRPVIVVISVGRNSYGHPDPWALRYYAAVAEGIFRTDVLGDIVIVARTDGSFTVATPRTGETWSFPAQEEP